MSGVTEHDHAAKPGHGLLKELQSFAGELGGNIREPGDVAARSTQTLYKSSSNGIAADRHDDGKGLRRFASRIQRKGITRDDDLDRETNQLGREVWKPREVALRVSAFDLDVPALNPSQLSQALRE